jgi:pimeloyl-ACP methyl ester carboxylesterase
MKKISKAIKLVLAIVLIGSIALLLLYGHSDIPLDELKAKYTNSASYFIEVDGMDVHYRDEGNSTDSIPLVLLHGTGASLHTFDVWTKELKKSRRVIRMDLPAFGLTGPFPDANYSTQHYVAFINEFVTSLGIQKCILAGNSLGGQIAWNFALAQPDKVGKLILIDAAGYPKAPKSEPMAFKVGKIPVLKNIFTYVTPRSVAKASIENVYFDTSKVTDSLVDRYFELTLRAGNRQAFVDRLNRESEASDYTNIKNVQQPTLILWGDQDLLVPVENAYKFQADLPNDTLVIFKNLGHVPMEESPDESLLPVLDFLKN